MCFNNKKSSRGNLNIAKVGHYNFNVNKSHPGKLLKSGFLIYK
jgi:hypothetical protein